MCLKTALRWLAAALLALLAAPIAHAQTRADPPTNVSYNFRTGTVTFTRGACGDSVFAFYRYATTGNFERALRPGSTNQHWLTSPATLTELQDKDYVEVYTRMSGDTGCGLSSNATPTVIYRAVTVSSNRHHWTNRTSAARS